MLLNRQLGDYVLLRRLAVGGQSEVFLALKEGPDAFWRPLVIKALPTRYRQDPKFVELFYREAFLSARFSHPHVITVHDARILEQEYCMIMDFIAGQTVADIAQRGYKRGRPPSVNQAVQIVADACDGLDYTHQFRDLDDTPFSVVHRDVSPQNLMVTYEGVTKVFDFGIAKIQESSADHDTLAGGKYAYMSPEQCLERPVDARSDIFSLGVILYELSVGRRLFRRGSRGEVVQAITAAPIEPPGHIDETFPADLDQVIMRALERDPDSRYQRAGQMRDDLLQLLSERSDGRQRHQLGEYVTDLFADERADIARTIRAASNQDVRPRPLGNTALERLGRDDDDGAAYDDGLAVPMPEPTHQANLSSAPGSTGSAGEQAAGPAALNDGGSSAAPTAEVDRSRMRQAHRKNKNLADEVRRLNRRQSLLVMLLVLVGAAAVGLAYVHFSQRSAEPKTVEIGSSPS